MNFRPDIFFVVGFCLFVFIVSYRKAIAGWLASLFAGKRTHELHSHIQALLEVSIQQSAAILEIRDGLRALPIQVLDPKALGEAISRSVNLATRDAEVVEQLRWLIIAVDHIKEVALKSIPTEKECQENVDFDARMEARFQKMADLLGQIAASNVNTEALSEKIEAALDQIQEFNVGAGGKMLSKIEQIRDRTVAATVSLSSLDSLAALNDKNSEKMLAQLEKNDQRMFEFVASTKRIMHAMEGQGTEDDDVVIEEARMIKAKALDRGVELSLEDAIKRAREVRIYSNGR